MNYLNYKNNFTYILILNRDIFSRFALFRILIRRNNLFNKLLFLFLIVAINLQKKCKTRPLACVSRNYKLREKTFSCFPT